VLPRDIGRRSRILLDIFLGCALSVVPADLLLLSLD
jgi:hypothetical protein